MSQYALAQMQEFEAVDMAHLLTVLVALPEDTGSVLSPPILDNSHLHLTQAPWD